MPETLDITPSPRVLRMLGQIDFQPWQCLAELIDNSVDAFIELKSAGRPIAEPRVRIILPTQKELDTGTGQLVVEDNAAGMTIEALGNAVKAGYSGNDPVDKMGLFGMGFNISTARLGRRTEVWTTTADAPDWLGIVIDFGELEKLKSFHAPVLRRPKSEYELEHSVHGTRICVSRLEAERLGPLAKGTGKSRTKKRLGKIYGRVMMTHGIEISYDGDVVLPWKHCVWAATRTVPTAEFGDVPARIEINRSLSPRRFCATCWTWLGEHETVCNACGKNDNLILRPRTIRGWIGVQRYFDKSHFGLDLIRNGRVIEELDKSFFSYRDQATGDDLLEYPRDAVHWGGRLVGELEIDFVRVSHQKDSFDKLDPEWREVVREVRGESPLQPVIAARMGLGKNTSPLAKLFAGYRKGHAGLKNLVPADANGAGLNTGLVKEYVDGFYRGDAEYQDDSKWYELVIQGVQKKRGELDPDAGPPPQPPEEEEEADGPAPPTSGDENDQDPTASQDDIVPPELDINLSQTYELPMLPGSPVVQVQAFRHRAKPAAEPFSVEPGAGKLRFEYNLAHSYFRDSLITPEDCLVVDLAQHFLALSGGTPRQTPVSRLVTELRTRYFPELQTDVASVVEQADSILKELMEHYNEILPSVAPIDASLLSSSTTDHIRMRAHSMEMLSSSQAEDAIRKGHFVRYLKNEQLLELIQLWPALALDEQFFGVPYMDEDVAIRNSGMTSVLNSLSDTIWLAEVAGNTIHRDGPWRLQYARALASLRLLQFWQA